MIHIDPVSRQRISYQQFSGDLEYDVTGGSSISTQVVSKVGKNGVTGMEQINLGQSNKLFGTEAGLRGDRIPDLGVTGENKQTTERVVIRRRVTFDGND